MKGGGGWGSWERVRVVMRLGRRLGAQQVDVLTQSALGRFAKSCFPSGAGSTFSKHILDHKNMYPVVLNFSIDPYTVGNFLSAQGDTKRLLKMIAMQKFQGFWVRNVGTIFYVAV